MQAVTGAGRVIAGRYRLLDLVGQGAMGTVWRAHDPVLAREVALKEIRLPAVMSEADRRVLRQRTLREARVAGKLNHPGVVTVYDVVEADGNPWIVMELVPARSLERLLKEEGPLPPRRVADIGVMLLEALASAHSAGIVHRDVKPANVLVTGDGRAVLSDFGIATLEGEAGLTQAGMVMGTPGFCAPERIRGEPASPASDLWSLGATLYAAVEGRGPYQSHESPMAILASIVHFDPPEAPSAGTLGPVISALMGRDPARRPDAAHAARMLTAAASQGRQARGAASPAAPPQPQPQAPATRAATAQPRVPATRAATPEPEARAEACAPPGAMAAPAARGAAAGPAARGPEADGDVPWPWPPRDVPTTPWGPGARPHGQPAHGQPPHGQPPTAAVGHRRTASAPSGTPTPSGRHRPAAAPWQAAADSTATGPTRRAPAGPAPVAPFGAGPGVPGRAARAQAGGAAGAPGTQAGVGPGGSRVDAMGRAGTAAPAGPADRDKPPRTADREAARRRWPVIAGAGIAIVCVGLLIGAISSRAPRRRPAGQPSSAPSQPGPSAAALPAGYRWYSSPPGAAQRFSVAVPSGWRVRQQGATASVRDPATGAAVKLVAAGNAGVVKQTRVLAHQASAKLPGYRRIAIGVSPLRGSLSASLRFSYLRSGTELTEGLDVVARFGPLGARQTQEFLLTAPASDWISARAALGEMLRTFRPQP